MEEQCSPLNWSYCYLEEGVEEFKNSLVYSTLELEAAVISAHEEISRKDEEIVQLKDVLGKIINERDEFKAKCNTLVFEKQLLLQQLQVQTMSSKNHLECPLSSGTTSNEDEYIALSPSHSDGNTIFQSSPGAKNPTFVVEKDVTPLTSPTQPALDIIDQIALKRALPENRKFLQAVMDAGPLLQTLMLAGPLPQWQHPPPPLNSIDIPPVTISSSSPVSSNSTGQLSNKRPMMMMDIGTEFSPKYQKVVHQSSLTQHLVSP